MREPPILFRYLLRLGFALLLLVVLAGSAAFLMRAQLLQDLARPLLVRELSRRSQSVVAIDRLLLVDNRLQLEKVRIERTGTARLDLDRLELVLSWGILSDRHLPRLLLFGPKLRLFGTAAAAGTGAGAWPDSPPFTIGEVAIRNGEILLPGAGGVRWRIEGQGVLDRQWRLKVHLQPGDLADQALTVEARGTWDGEIRGELSGLQWGARELLGEPLRLALGSSGMTALGGGFHLARIDDSTLRPLLALAAVQLPTEPHWQLNELALEPSWDGSRLRLGVRIGSGLVRSEERELRLGPVELVVNGAPEDWELTGKGQLGAESHLEGKLRLRTATLEGRVSLALADLSRLSLEQPGLGLPSLAGSATLELRLSGSIRHPKFALKTSTRKLTAGPVADLLFLDLQAEARVAEGQDGWQLTDGALTGALSGPVSGTLAGRFAGQFGSQESSLALSELELAQLSWTAADGLSAYVGERLRLQGEFTAPASAPARFALQGEVAGGELLHGSYYASLAGISLGFDLRGQATADGYSLDRARLALPQLGELSLTGNWGARESRLLATLDLPDLRQALQAHGDQLLGEPFPQLKSLALAGGLRIGGQGLFNDQGWRLFFELAPRELALKRGEELQVAGLSGVLPVQLGTLAEQQEIPGKLAWTKLVLGPLWAAAGEVALLSGPGRLQLPGEFPLGLAGGTLVLAGLKLDLPPQPFAIATRLKVSGVQLQSLTDQLGWPELNGSLSGDLGRLHYGKGELGIAGAAGIEVFDGHIGVRNMRLRELFSPYPVFQADLDFTGIDLYRLTNTFAFGEMNGVIDGHIHQLRLFGLTPTHFEAVLKTRASGRRNISVKALNNLTILSQGGLSAALSRGIHQFIDFYRYRRIGIACSLENDLFRLRGTALEGSDRYLVHGGLLPPRIDVITSVPTVSFREMVKRLKRLDRAGSGGPAH
jgi:hypothetical protein